MERSTNPLNTGRNGAWKAWAERARHVVPVLAVAGLAACATRNPLEPAKAAERVPGMDDAAQVRTMGARVVVQVDNWDGSDTILDDVTPVWVEVINDTGRPLVVDYDNFSLVAPDGTHYAALAPIETQGSASVPAAYLTADAGYGAPYGVYDPFMLGTDYGWGYYPGPALAYDYDYPYYYGDWVRVPLPTPDMIAKALPEGILEPGGISAGFVYFERVDDDDKAVEFAYALVDAETGNTLDVATIPFEVKDIL